MGRTLSIYRWASLTRMRKIRCCSNMACIFFAAVELPLFKQSEQRRYSPSWTLLISRGLFREGACRKQHVLEKEARHLRCVVNELIEMRLYLKDGTNRTLCKTILGVRVTVPTSVTLTL